MKIFKNKFFIITLSIAIFAVILTSTLKLMGKGDIVKDAVNIAATPFRIVARKINESVSGYSKYFDKLERLYKENQELREKIESLEKELDAERGASEENERLRAYLDIKSSHPDFTLLDALIISESGENFITFLTLNRGSGDGVKLGMPVINEVGLVGNVCEVGYSWCKVRLLSEASSGAGAYIKRSGASGILSGVVPNKDGVTCVLEYLTEDADIVVGDIVYTSGSGSSYPRDIYVGKVVSVEVDKYLRTKVATVRCAVDPDSLDYLMIVTGYEIDRD